MLHINKVEIIGRPTDEPQYKDFGQHKIARFSVAVNRWTKKDDGTFDQKATFVDVQVWDKLVAKAQLFVQKGKLLYVDGRLEQDSWQDKTTGKNMSKLYVVANDIQAAERPDANEETPAPANAPAFMSAPLDPPPQHTLPPKRPQHDEDGGRVIVSSATDFANCKKEPPPSKPNGTAWTPPAYGESPF